MNLFGQPVVNHTKFSQIIFFQFYLLVKIHQNQSEIKPFYYVRETCDHLTAYLLNSILICTIKMLIVA